MAMYFPAWMQSGDSLRFARIKPEGLFSDYWMPAGYGLFAKTLREVEPALWVSVAFQHLIGLSIGILIYLSMRRVGSRPWLACIPAAVPLLSGDEIWIEHQIMSEPFLTALIAAGLFCAVRGLVPTVNVRWIAASSALLMAAALSRNVALVTLLILLLCIAFWVHGTRRKRAYVLLAGSIPAVILFGTYVTAFKVSDGQYLGMTNMSGWNLYARVAPFADCSKFTPPAGTQRLCESTPNEQRMGSLGYIWDGTTIGRSALPLDPKSGQIVGDFAKQVLLHQPLAYLKAVGTDAARYINPEIGPDRPLSGQPYEVQSFGFIDLKTREEMVEAMAHGYTGTEVHIHGREILAAYQDFFRLGGLLLAALFVFTLIGMVVARGAVRLGVFLFGLTALALYLIPVATLSYEVRYGLPPQPFIAVSGTLGFAALISRWQPGNFFRPSDR
jgi:hypothetical protein